MLTSCSSLRIGVGDQLVVVGTALLSPAEGQLMGCRWACVAPCCCQPVVTRLLAQVGHKYMLETVEVL